MKTNNQDLWKEQHLWREQWLKDVETDGDKAYLKWQFKHKNKDVWKDLECNAAIHRLPVFEFRRKE